jgi:hypothetical protein
LFDTPAIQSSARGVVPAGAVRRCCYAEAMLVSYAPIPGLTRIIGARARVEQRLRAARAFGPDVAVPFEAAEASDFAGLDEAIGLGRIVRTIGGRLFLNPAAIPEPRGTVIMTGLLLLAWTGGTFAAVAFLVRAALH